MNFWRFSSTLVTREPGATHRQCNIRQACELCCCHHLEEEKKTRSSWEIWLVTSKPAAIDRFQLLLNIISIKLRNSSQQNTIVGYQKPQKLLKQQKKSCRLWIWVRSRTKPRNKRNSPAKQRERERERNPPQKKEREIQRSQVEEVANFWVYKKGSAFTRSESLTVSSPCVCVCNIRD